jgi:hypothetical protein
VAGAVGVSGELRDMGMLAEAWLADARMSAEACTRPRAHATHVDSIHYPLCDHVNVARCLPAWVRHGLSLIRATSERHP